MKVLSAVVEHFFDQNGDSQVLGAFEYEEGEAEMTYDEKLGLLFIKRDGFSQAICIPRERILSMEVEI